MKINVKLDDGAYMPTRAHESDAGMDLYAREDTTVNAYDCAVFDTGVHIQIPFGYVGFLKSKSGLNVFNGLTGEGVIDSGYNGSIVVKLYNHSDEKHTFLAGDKIIQIVILPVELPELEVVDDLEDTDRGSNGFGSTGR